MNKETLAITISNNIAIHHIYSQAGSVEKAFGEAVMNAADAKATEIRIFIADNGVDYTITDNGNGFASREEITGCFGTLGFDHTTEKEIRKARTYGKFGLGRAMLWAWSRNVWKSGPFRMHVDIEANGLTYDLETTAEPLAGCTLEGEFYAPLSISELSAIQRNLKQLTQYMGLEIYFNDTLISKPLSEMSWSAETDEAYFRFSTSGGPLTVYNQGVLVCQHVQSKFGVSGIVMSKKNLELNVARNEVMLNRCKIWPEIVISLKEQARKSSKKPNIKLTKNDRNTMVSQILSCEELSTLTGKPVFQAVDGRYYSLTKIMKSFGGRITFGNSNFSPVGEQIIAKGSAIVLCRDILDHLGYDPDDFVASLCVAGNKASLGYGTLFSLLDYGILEAETASAAEVVDEKTLPKTQMVALATLRRLNVLAGKVENRALMFTRERSHNPRSIYIGKKASATAWTDGVTSIGYTGKEAVDSLKKGYKGVMECLLNLLHEYAHTDSNTSDHSHDIEFFKHFHDMAMNVPEFSYELHLILNQYGKNLIKAELVIPKSVARDIARNEAESMMKALEDRDLLAK
jgi:hypothetical protein